MKGSGLQIWGEMFPSHGDIWDTSSESVSHPLFAVDHSVYRSSALARIHVCLCLPLSISRSWSLNLYLERICLSVNGCILWTPKYFDNF